MNNNGWQLIKNMFSMKDSLKDHLERQDAFVENLSARQKKLWDAADLKKVDALSLIVELSDVANRHGLDTQSNMPDFIIGRFMFDSFEALMAANKANG